MKKGQTYTYEQITDFAYANDPADWDIIEHGRSVIGENFIVLKHENKDETISFVLSGANGKGNQYECVYSDLK
jgi:hypothetical protein